MSLVVSLLVGGAIGAALGYFGKCSSGACPLTANPWRGALYGAVLGLVFHIASARTGSSAADEPGANVRLVTEAQFGPEVAQADRPVVVDFFATWCGPCKRLSPMLDELAGPLSSRIKFLKVDVDQSPKLAQQFGIQGVPTLVFLKGGKVIDSLVGVPAKADLQQRLTSLAGASELAGAQ